MLIKALPKSSSNRSCLRAVSFVASICLTNQSAWSADWGYDDLQSPGRSAAKSSTTTTSGAATKSKSKAGNQTRSAPPTSSREQAAENGSPMPSAQEGGTPAKPVGLKAEPMRSLNSPNPSLPAPVGRASPIKQISAQQNEKRINAVEDWIELYSLVVKQPLLEEQKDNFRKKLMHKLDTPRANEVLAILDYWPQVQQHLGAGVDEKEAFASLFRSLLRFESRSKSICDDDADILSELLGPERIAVPGDPALTEDSVDAYGDMACFMYEQSHAGKTVDAVDNRTVFAAVICGKFEHAPSLADKKAMANFSLTWAKFKVTYMLAGETERQSLMKDVQAGKPPASKKDSLLSSIFTHGPWSTQ
jgi:hypothetical protein